MSGADEAFETIRMIQREGLRWKFAKTIAVADMEWFNRKLAEAGVQVAQSDRLGAAFFTGLRVVFNRSVPPDVVEFRNAEGEVIGRILARAP